MQIELSFLEWLWALRKWIDEKSAAEVAAGEQQTERPVFLMLDNHASRYSQEVLDTAHGQQNYFGIRINEEMSQTHQILFLQALLTIIPYFLPFLSEGLQSISRGVGSGKLVTKTSCQSVGAGSVSACMSLEDARGPGSSSWFTWAHMFDAIHGFRRVSIAWIFCLELIDRDNFIDRAEQQEVGMGSLPTQPVR